MSVTAFWDEVYETKEGARSPDSSCLAALEFFGNVRSKRLLEIGCGIGDNAVFWAKQGADVTAIDTSPVAVKKLRESSGGAIKAIELDALHIDKLGQFDFVCGSMILHHLEPFHVFARKLDQTMKPGARAFFFENNAMSQTLVWCREHLVGRFGIPKFGDDEEFPLTPGEVNLLRERFVVEQQYPQMLFFELISWYLLGRRLRAPLKALDRLAYRTPLRRFSYRQYVMLTKPI